MIGSNCAPVMAIGKYVTARDKPTKKEAGDAARITSNIAHFGKFASCLKARAFWFTPHPSVPVATVAGAWPSSYILDKAK
jgi:hypothetical protein